MCFPCQKKLPKAVFFVKLLAVTIFAKKLHRRYITGSLKNFWAVLGNSRPEVFCQKGVLKNFAKFKGKQLCQSLFFNKHLRATASEFRKKNNFYICPPF